MAKNKNQVSEEKPMPKKYKSYVKPWVRIVAIGCALLILGSAISILYFF